MNEISFTVLCDTSWLRVWFLPSKYSSWGYKKLAWYIYKRRAGKNIRLLNVGQIRITLGKLSPT